MTTIFLIRHSVKFESKIYENYNAPDDKNEKDEKTILSIDGEKRAEILSNEAVFENVDVIYSSSMVRSIATAKYLCSKLNLKINIDKRLNERRYGIQNSDQFKDWFSRQYLDENFKTTNGESQKDVSERVHACLEEILKSNKNKTIAVFTHGYAITFALLKWCKLISVDETRKLKYEFNNKIIFDKIINAPEVFKLEFDNNNELINIELIEFDDLPYAHGGI